jgi:uncharacterized protein
MEPIYIPQVANRRDKTLEIVIDRFVEDLATLTPVRGKITVRHQGNYLDVGAEVETIVTLTCDRCLQQYNHKLNLQTNEIIWLDPAAAEPYRGPLEQETAVEDLVESLPPDGHFQPDTWLYEQLCLAIPQRQICDRACEGIATQEPLVNAEPEITLDRRWGALEILKNQLNDRT